jgi:hypothetical protein
MFLQSDQSDAEVTDFRLTHAAVAETATQPPVDRCSYCHSATVPEPVRTGALTRIGTENPRTGEPGTENPEL